MEQIQHSRPWLTEADIVAVQDVLASSMVGQGRCTQRLECRLAEWLRVEDGVAVGSGAAAIVLALHGLGVGVGDEVVLPTYVCGSVLEAVLTAGAVPVLCDTGPDWVMTVSAAASVVTDRTRAIIVPHLYGIFADVDSFRSLGLPIIEDCAQALDGAGMTPARGDVAVLSFHPTKCLTAGEGGMALASDRNVLARMRRFRDGDESGYRGRLFSPLSNIGASLVLSQLDRYEQGLARRREIAAHYRKIIEMCCPDSLNRIALDHSMYFRFPVHVPGGLSGCQLAFSQQGVQVRKGVDELLHRKLGGVDALYPVATGHFDKTVSFPIYPALSVAQEARCADAIASILPTLVQPLN